MTSWWRTLVRGLLLTCGLLLTIALATATPTEAQSYNCASSYFGYSCYAGASTATCGTMGYWGDVRCSDSRGSFGWTSPTVGPSSWAYNTGSYSSLLLPSVPAPRTPSYLDTWMTGSTGGSSRYCALLAALGC